MVKLHVGKEIVVTGLPTTLRKTVQKAMTLPNPTFAIMRNMGKDVRFTPPFFEYSRLEVGDSGQSLVIPRGSFTRFKGFLTKNNIEFEVDTSSLVSEKDERFGFLPEIKLRDYQEPIVSRVAENRPSEGVFEMGTGTGKTLVALELIRRMGLKATILCAQNTWIAQFAEEMKKWWGMEEKDLFVCNGESKEIGFITLATFQTLAANPKLLAELSAQTSVLIVDECHGIPTDSRMEVLKQFAPSHLYGLTGSPERTDQQTEAVFFLLGEIIEKHEGTLLKPEVEVVRTRTFIPYYDEYYLMIDDMVNNKSRNTLIHGIIMEEMFAGRKVLCLVKRIEHYKLLQQFYVTDEGKEWPGLYFISSENSDRNEILMEMRSGERNFNALFGTTSLLSTGLDIPALDTLVIACDLKSSVLTTQSAGRILRLFQGKPTPKIIDLWDNENSMLTNQFNNRMSLYRKKGWATKFR
jgi:superfamily II DNA or RNA helicase